MPSLNPYRDDVVGVDLEVPLSTGERTVYINFDNAASTPALKAVKEAGDKLIDWYASIHRGAGFKSQVASEWYEMARDITLDFVNGNPETHCVIFTSNTTDYINRLARKFPRDEEKSIIISNVEHHANDLPWRDRGAVVRVDASNNGEISPAELDRILGEEGDRARLVSLTGASNVVGTIQPIHDFARVAHKHGIPIAIDAAQMAPHLPINMQGDDAESSIDFLFISGHKMYAPFGGGALIGPKDFFGESEPSLRGGGAVLVVNPDEVDWAEAPERDEAGSPNVLGAITLAAAMRELQKIGFDELEKSEIELAKRFITGLKKIDGSVIYGLENDEDMHRRLGVVAFNLGDIPHGLVAAVLAHEAGIGVRNGCFCAHPFMLQLMNVPEEVALDFRERILNGDRSGIPGTVRVSFGLYNTEQEVDKLLDTLKMISEGRQALTYTEEKSTGRFIPDNGEENYASFVESLMN